MSTSVNFRNEVEKGAIPPPRQNGQSVPTPATWNGDQSRTGQATGSGSGPPPEQTVIRPTRGWQLINLRELWQYRELIYFLTWRDVKIRYKQTVLGAAWAVLQPAMMMVVFSIFFGHIAGVPAGDL